MKKSNVITIVVLFVVGAFLIFGLPALISSPVEVSAEENAAVVEEYVFEKGEIQFITSKTNINYCHWEATVYFPEINESHVVTIPDSVLDDISVGWSGYFGFRPDYYNPQWIGLNYNP